MCARITATTNDEVADLFGLAHDTIPVLLPITTPRYNVAPSTLILVARTVNGV